MPLHRTVGESSQLMCSALLYFPEIQLLSEFSCVHLICYLHRCPFYYWSHLLLLVILVTNLCESSSLPTLSSRLKALCEYDISTPYFIEKYLFHKTYPKNLQCSIFIVEWQAALTSLLKDLNLQLLFFLEVNRKCWHLSWCMYIENYVLMDVVVFTHQWPILHDISLAPLALCMHTLLCTVVSLHSIVAATMNMLVVVRCSNKIRYLSSRRGWVSLLL